MKILKKRPLATILIVWLGGFSLFGVLDVLPRVLLCLSLAIVWCLLSLLRKPAIKRRMLHTLCITCALSFLFSGLYFDHIFSIDKRFEEETSVTLCGYVSDVLYTDGYYTVAYMKVDNVNEQPLSSCTVCLTDEEGSLTSIAVGDRLTVQATLSSATGEEGDSEIRRIGQGISADATVLDRLDDGKEAPHALTVWRDAQMTAFIERASEVSNDESAALLAALILGERAYLSPMLKQDFTRIGITHLLALSGLHLSILSLLVLSLLSLFGLRKTTRKVILCLLIAGYIVLTGAPSSLLRAGIMLILSSLLFLIRRPHDSITTLCVTVFLICLVTPYAVYDLDLWLSALATLGILLLLRLEDNQEADKPLVWWKRPIRLVTQSVLLSVGAQAASLLLCVLSFDTISLVSPISTFVFGSIIQILMYVGLAAMLVGGAIPIVGDALEALTELITRMARTWSGGRYVYVDASFTAVRILAVAFTVLLVLFVLCSVQHKRIALTVLACTFASIYLCAFALTYDVRASDTQLYYSDTTQEGFVLTTDGYAAAIDIGTGGAPFGEVTTQTLASHHIRYLDAYILTRYSVYLSSTVRCVLESVHCEHVYLPAPSNEWESNMCALVLQRLDMYGVPYTIYEPTSGVRIADTSVTMPYRTVKESSTMFWMTIEADRGSLVYFTRGSVDEKTQTAASQLTARCDTVLFGCCGYATEYVLDLYVQDSVRVCVIADPKIRIREDRYQQYKATMEVVLFPKEYKIKR
ncbi:MAG: ComEC/Rec2 family competence protein [Clostridia bacterium]|nr:ComEC/Rec2 family competence protein [Clostridia bacterium]